jgi:hypothetical protein
MDEKRVRLTVGGREHDPMTIKVTGRWECRHWPRHSDATADVCLVAIRNGAPTVDRVTVAVVEVM